ncbi:MAG: site-2 protease family protein [Nanoarchaeota archaeon]|nr:site-2 protease family protein [Nanoarchaeota archaeon]
MSIDYIAMIIFLAFLSFIIILKRKKIQIQKVLFPFIYVLLIRTKLGIKQMSWFAEKFKRPLKYIGYFSIFIGFLGMALMAFLLVQNMIRMFITPSAVSGVALVLPVKAKGIFYVPFLYWIISIFILAVIHEFSHGVFAKAAKLKIKSSGFAVLALLVPILPAAFVEPDEKKIVKKSRQQQLAIYSAGPFANIVFALLIAVLMTFAVMPLASGMIEGDGILISSFIKEDKIYPAEQAGITEGDIIKGIDNMETPHLIDFKDILNNKKPGDIVLVKTNKDVYNITLAADPVNSSKPYLGVFISQKTKISESFRQKYGEKTALAFIWAIGLLSWLYLLNLGIGLFNLLPLGPLDGGRMLLVSLEKFYKKEIAKKIWNAVSLFFLILIIANIAFAFIK